MPENGHLNGSQLLDGAKKMANTPVLVSRSRQRERTPKKWLLGAPETH